MAWADVYAYILSLAPDLREAVVGVPEEHLAACEHNWGLALPSAYRDFLACMGVEAGHFSPFAGKEWNFYELLRDPPEDYRPQQFFRVAVDVDDNLIVKSELYLDMATVRPDGDCDVIQIEWLTDPASSPPLTERETFLAWVLRVSWMALDGKRFAHDRLVFAKKDTTATIENVLSRVGFFPALPSQGGQRVWSRRDGALASVRISGGSITTVVIASDDAAFVSRVMQLLLDNVPGTEFDPRFPSLINR